MQVPITPELRMIAQEIESENLSEVEWAAREASDTFQTDSFCGGYDADESAFLFSWYATDGCEYYFSLSREDVRVIATGGRKDIVGNAADG